MIVGVCCVFLLGCLQYSYAFAETSRYDPSLVMNPEALNGSENTTIVCSDGASRRVYQSDLIKKTGNAEAIIPFEADAARKTHSELSCNTSIRIAACSVNIFSPIQSETIPMGAARFRIKPHKTHNHTVLDKITRWILTPLYFIAAHPMPFFIILVLILIGVFFYVYRRVSK
jgi:hypothetical protein